MSQSNRPTLGSLFDGIGGFPYAASFYGIKPLWASEILPAAVSVTKRHFPNMEHVGNITRLDGSKLPPVSILTFGSPCQGLSTAGQRLGLADERSGLFMEAIRIIREMREATNGKYPQIALWENVPGAFSSAGGTDYQAVLEAFTATKIPIPRSKKWANAGMVRGRGIDLAWCVYCASHFGLAQRRRRIFLVADFTGQCAGEILFVPKSLRRYFEAGGTPRQAAAAYAESRAGTADKQNETVAHGDHGKRIGKHTTMMNALGEGDGSIPGDLACAAFMCGQSASSGSIAYNERVSPTLRSSSGSNMAPCVCEPNIARTLTARGDSSPCVDRGQNIVAIKQVSCAATGQANAEILENCSPTLVAGHEQPYIAHETPAIPIHDKATRCNGGGPTRKGDGAGNGLGIGKDGDPAPTITSGDRHAVAAVDCRNLNETGDLSGALQAKNAPGYSLNFQNPVRIDYIIRRLTPTECERLQGYPDGWTECGHDGKPISDSKRYQMLGNSIAVPCVAYIMQGIITALAERK